MHLTITERLILLNQFEILKKLDSTNSESYDDVLEILANGYEFEYDELFHKSPTVTFRKEPFPEEIREEVIDILLMFVDLKYSFELLDDKSGIDKSAIEFRGFDGNNESDYLHYAEYMVNKPQNKVMYEGIEISNTHMPTLQFYRTMFSEYKNVKENLKISKEEMLKIIDASRNFD